MPCAARLALVVLATARLTRLVTTDTLPEWAFIGRLRHRAEEAEHETRERMREVMDRERQGVRALAPEDPQKLAVLKVNRRWSTRLNDGHPVTWSARAVKGLDCPFCVGFWLGAAVLVSDRAVRTKPLLTRLRAPWHLALGALALNYVVGHVSSRIDG